MLYHKLMTNKLSNLLHNFVLIMSVGDVVTNGKPPVVTLRAFL